MLIETKSSHIHSFFFCIPSIMYLIVEARKVNAEFGELLKRSQFPKGELVEQTTTNLFAAGVTQTYKTSDEDGLFDAYNHYCSFFQEQEDWYASKVSGVYNDIHCGLSREGFDEGKRFYKVSFCKKNYKTIYLYLIKPKELSKKDYRIKVRASYKPGTTFLMCQT
ncbi:hypothetical protein [Leucothrix arctica]|uniref:Uncharacterized protein n=1 Tax=Leucothrix arctica TaxID=1481894 RepID=A0A317CCT0_9GAMM|nr:hypothetical protein [Leucothrix arctica]PWQ96187.1 hypothetical protein DKT75_09335 [Leucothrix arctica]